MCIKFDYLKSLVKSAATLFYFGKKPTEFEENSNVSLYYKNELSERIQLGTDDHQLQQLLEDVENASVDSADFVSARIEEIINLTQINPEYKTPAFDLWKSMLKIEKFTKLSLEAQAAGCLYGVAKGEFGEFRRMEMYVKAPEPDLEYCMHMAWIRYNNKYYIEFCLQHRRHIIEPALEIAAVMIDKCPNNSDLNEVAVTAAACHVACTMYGYNISLEKFATTPDDLEKAKEFVADFLLHEEELFDTISANI